MKKKLGLSNNFHGLRSFHERFVKDFSTIATHLIEIVQLHEVPKSIMSNHDVKVLSCFWQVLWGKQGTKFLFFTTCHP
jgi:hypothetical protein